MAKLPPMPVLRENLDWETIRQGLATRKAGLLAQPTTPQTGFTKEETTVKARDGYDIPVTVYKPEKPRQGGAPLIVLYHGGGFVIGDRGGEELNSRLVAAKLGCIAVNVEYRLAPEHPFPIPANDAWDALKWVCINVVHVMQCN
jgi:acetyl esterase/lipase